MPDLSVLQPTWELRPCDNRDANAGIGSLPDRAVDVVITDPPYSRNVHERSRRGLSARAANQAPNVRARRRRDLGFPPLKARERAAMARELARVTRRWVVVFSDHEGSHAWKKDLEAAGLEYVRTCIWIKAGATPQLTGDRPASGHECLVVAHQTRRGKPMRKRWNGGGKLGVYWHPIELDRARAGTRCHTTQKPLGLLRELIEDFSDPGELVCDPYAGSGTTGVACLQLGRDFLGWERDMAMAEMARRRLVGLRAIPVPGQLEMFG
jgi:DNA modification methylase